MNNQPRMLTSTGRFITSCSLPLNLRPPQLRRLGNLRPPLRRHGPLSFLGRTLYRTAVVPVQRCNRSVNPSQAFRGRGSFVVQQVQQIGHINYIVTARASALWSPRISAPRTRARAFVSATWTETSTI